MNKYKLVVLATLALTYSAFAAEGSDMIVVPGTNTQLLLNGI